MRSRMIFAVALLLAAASLSIAPSSARAQDTPTSAWSGAPHPLGALDPQVAAAWLGAWSPLRSTVAAPRGLLRAPLAPGLLDAPRAPVGAFVLAGAPGALTGDLRRFAEAADGRARWGELRLRAAGESGDFRRPLDVAETSVVQAAGQGWAPVGTRGIAIGRFVVDQEDASRSAFTSHTMPYRGSPFIISDSITPIMARTRARIEGALGLDVAGFGVGLAAGIDTREHNSVDVPLRRSGRETIPAASLGVERALPWASLRIGAHYRWQESSETNVLNARPQPTVLYAQQGYEEPFPLPVTSTTPQFWRIDRRATAWGGSVGGVLFGTDIVVVHERGRQADDQTRAPFSAIRDVDRWRADGDETRVQLARALPRGWRAQLVARTQRQRGEARRADLDGIAVRGGDGLDAVELEVRTRADATWQFAALGGVVRQQHDRTDFVALLSADVPSIAPFASVEVRRRAGRGALAAGASFVVRTPRNAIVPPPAELGPNYQRLIAPALAYDVAEASASAAWLTVRWPVRSTTLVGGVRAERTSAAGENAARLQPVGTRGGWSVSLGLVP